MKVRLAADIETDSITNGEGIRAVVWFQGCLHNCPGCHNPETHDLNGGVEYDISDVKKMLDKLEYQTGITLSGGDPFFQIDSAIEIAKYAHELGLNVWAYTGFLWDALIKDEKKKMLLENIDVLVDGKFKEELKSLNCKFRGSTNQRIIDVNKSMLEGKVVLYED